MRAKFVQRGVKISLPKSLAIYVRIMLNWPPKRAVGATHKAPFATFQIRYIYQNQKIKFKTNSKANKFVLGDTSVN